MKKTLKESHACVIKSIEKNFERKSCTCYKSVERNFVKKSCMGYKIRWKKVEADGDGLVIDGDKFEMTKSV